MTDALDRRLAWAPWVMIATMVAAAAYAAFLAISDDKVARAAFEIVPVAIAIAMWIQARRANRTVADQLLTAIGILVVAHLVVIARWV